MICITYLNGFQKHNQINTLHYIQLVLETSLKLLSDYDREYFYVNQLKKHKHILFELLTEDKLLIKRKRNAIINFEIFILFKENKWLYGVNNVIHIPLNINIFLLEQTVPSLCGKYEDNMTIKI